ncbi:GtrA family protein [Chloroflexota bacterium]
MGSSHTPGAIIERASIRLGGANAKEYERFIKFFIVGIIGFIVDFGTLNLLQLTILPPETNMAVLIATTIAFTAAIMSNFVWNRYWTYPDSRSRPVLQQLGLFYLVNAVGLLFRIVIVSLLYQPLGAIGAASINFISPGAITDTLVQNQIGTNLTQAIAVFIAMFWNFFVNRYWTYNDVE